MPHITLKSIANNAEIDVIWEKWQEALEPLRAALNAALGKSWEEWEIPREAGADWPAAAKDAHARWWEARIARQKEIDASIAAKAEFEYLYDKPYVDNARIRVAGPFTVESLSPHRTLAVDWNDELIDQGFARDRPRHAPMTARRRSATSPAMILENLKAAGVQQADKEDRIAFTSLTGWPGQLHLRRRRLHGGRDGSAAPASSSAPSSAPSPAPTSSPPRARRATPASTC